MEAFIPDPSPSNVRKYSPRQAVILICATNRPEELDDRFVLPGRIDREIHIGLPGEKERVKMFAVHSTGKHLAKDVNFQKLAFRTVGYSGADVRNLANEAGIMAIAREIVISPANPRLGLLRLTWNGNFEAPAHFQEEDLIKNEEVEEIVKSMNPIMISDPLRMPDLNLDNMEITAPPNTRLRYDYLDIYPAPLHRC